MSQRNGGGRVSEYSVLAETFVPENLRRINHFPATVILFAGQPIDPSAVGPKGLIVPFVPICYCNGPDSKQVFMGESLHIFPVPRDVPPNLYYAIDHRNERLHSTSSMLNDTTIQDVGEAENLPIRNLAASLSSLDNMENLEEYVKVWESVLDLERSDVLLKYERFSQYSKAIVLQAATEQPDESTSSTVVQHSASVATIEIQGIADASPPLMIGDLVLLRPMQPISLPFPNQPHRPLEMLAWSAASNVVEIHSTVLQVHRGVGKRKDYVRVSWLNSYDAVMLSYSMKALGRISECFNVRFVPSVIRHERCLTALDWLVTVGTRISSISSMIEFLFPTAAPSNVLSLDPTIALDGVHFKELNHTQSSFVKMVLARALQPSIDSIRGPLILTGPAGTGR